jgi:ATP-dependent Zn protease
LPRIAPEAHAEAFIQRWGASLFDSSVESNRKRLGHLLRSEYQQARRRGLLAQALMRSARKEDRKISWTDLIEVATHGTRERDFQPQTEGQRLKNAVHEAGHVLISYLCTGQAPIYCSVRDSGNDHGVTVMPYDLVEAFNQDMSYAGAIEQIRMALAGRAAEHLVLGAQNVSLYGAKDDLRLAKELATQMHALAGMPIETHDDAAAGSNLCVASSEKDTVGRESFIAMINRVLQREFLQTIGMIKAERAVLERIVNDLRDREVLLEEDLVNLLQPA